MYRRVVLVQYNNNDIIHNVCRRLSRHRCLLDISYHAFTHTCTKKKNDYHTILYRGYCFTRRGFPLDFRDRTLSRHSVHLRNAGGMDKRANEFYIHTYIYRYLYTARIRVGRRRSSAVDCRSVGHLKNRSSG